MMRAVTFFPWEPPPTQATGEGDAMAKKNAKHKGIYTVKRKDGTMSYGIDYVDPLTGQRVRKILKGATSLEEARTLRSIEIADRARGAIDKAYDLKSRLAPVLFEDMIDKYLEWARENKRSWATDGYRAVALKKVFKGKLMSDITPFLVDKFKVIRAKQVSKSSVNKELILGSQVFSKAVEWGKFNGQNPFKVATRFKIRKGKKPGSLSPEEVRAIMDQIKHPVKRDMVEFDFNTGWRISEIRKLKWEDVDLETSTAWIMDPKNGEPVQIPLNDAAVGIIARQKRRGEYVFCHLNGNPYKTNLTDVIKSAAKKAGVALPPRKAWHILRRTWASMFLQNGGDVETLRQLGNWKDHSMPLWYADPADTENKRKILNRLPSLNGRKTADSVKVVKLRHLGSSGATRGGSSPPSRTKQRNSNP